MKSHIRHLTLSGQGGQCAVLLFRKHLRFFSSYTWSPPFDFCDYAVPTKMRAKETHTRWLVHSFFRVIVLANKASHHKTKVRLLSFLNGVKFAASSSAGRVRLSHVCLCVPGYVCLCLWVYLCAWMYPCAYVCVCVPMSVYVNTHLHRPTGWVDVSIPVYRGRASRNYMIQYRCLFPEGMY